MLRTKPLFRFLAFSTFFCYFFTMSIGPALADQPTSVPAGQAQQYNPNSSVT